MDGGQPSTIGHARLKSIFELADRYPLGGSRDAHALSTLFDFSNAIAPCKVTAELSVKYGMAWKHNP